jgi:hypothetical protein
VFGAHKKASKHGTEKKYFYSGHKGYTITGVLVIILKKISIMITFWKKH